MESVKCLKKRGVIATVPKIEAVGMYRPRLEDLALEDGFNFEVGNEMEIVISDTCTGSKIFNQIRHYFPELACLL